MATESPWDQFQGRTWRDTVKGMEALGPVTFRESADAGALWTILTGVQAGGGDPERQHAAMAKLVTSSVIDPLISREIYYGLDAGAQIALVGTIVAHYNKDPAIQEKLQDFHESSAGPTEQVVQVPESPPTTPSGGSGGRARVSVKRHQSTSSPD